MQLRRWEELNPERLRYHMIFSDDEIVPVNEMQPVIEFVPALEEAAV